MSPEPADQGSVDPIAFEEAARARLSRVSEDVDLEVMSMVFDMIRVVNRFLHDFDQHVYRPMGLSWAGFRVLFCLWVQPGSSSARLAVLSGVSRATVSSVLNTLERDGLVSRHRRSQDRRVVTVTLTGAGERVVREAFLRQHAREREWLSKLSGDRILETIEVLRDLLSRPAPQDPHASLRHDDVS